MQTNMCHEASSSTPWLGKPFSLPYSSAMRNIQFGIDFSMNTGGIIKKSNNNNNNMIFKNNLYLKVN